MTYDIVSVKFYIDYFFERAYYRNMKLSLKQKIHDEIMDMIMQNKFPIDEFLKEGALAEMFQVSKAPVREALIELCNEKIIRNIPRSGYQIIQLTERDFRETIQFRAILESQGLALSKDRLTEHHLELLENSLIDKAKAQRYKASEFNEWWDLNTWFHIELITCANNSLLTNALKDVLYLQKRINMQLFWNERPETYLTFNHGTHTKIFKALSNRDFGLAEELLIGDIHSIHDSLKL